MRGMIVLIALALLAGCTKSREQEPDSAPLDAPQSVVAPQTPEIDTNIVVEVDGVGLRADQIARQTEDLMRSRRIAPDSPRATTLRNQLRDGVIDQFITKTLLLNEATRRELSANAKEVDTEIEVIKKGLPPGMTLEQMMERNAVRMDRLRFVVGERVILNKLLVATAPDCQSASDEEIATYTEKHKKELTVPASARASHILIISKPDAPADQKDAARKKAEDIRQQILDGADFAELAKEHSACLSAPNGGDLGTFARGSGRIAPELDKEAFSRELGEVGPIVESDFGFHVLKVVSRSPETMASRDHIAAALVNEKSTRAAQQLVNELRGKAVVNFPTHHTGSVSAVRTPAPVNKK